MEALTIPARLVALDRDAIEALAQAHLDAAQGLLGLLDRHDGDADLEPAGDEQDASWTEYLTRGRHKLAGGMSEPFTDHEDSENDDPDQGHDEGEPDFIAVSDGGAGCPIADPGGCEHDGREEEHG